MRIPREPSTLEIMIAWNKLENVEYFSCVGNMIKMMQDIQVKLNLRLTLQKQ
jgi:hypothetical protein